MNWITRARQRDAWLLAIVVLGVALLLAACGESVAQPQPSSNGTTGNNLPSQQTQSTPSTQTGRPTPTGQPGQPTQAAQPGQSTPPAKATPNAHTAKVTPSAQAAGATPSAQPSSSSTSQVQSVNQQIQNTLQSLDQAQQDANNNNSSQDNGQQP